MDALASAYSAQVQREKAAEMYEEITRMIGGRFRGMT